MSTACLGLWLKTLKWWTNEVRTSTHTSYVIDLAKLEANCRILQYVQEEAGCKVLLAQKAYSLYKTYPMISQYLSGTTASGL